MDLARLESFIFDRMTTTRLPGLSIALFENDKVTYARGFGMRDLKHGLPATPATLYGIGSITKSFTALAILQLTEAGQLRLEDAVSDYVPFPFKPKGETVRLKHLLTHTVGLPALAYSEALIRHAHRTGGKALPIASPEDILTFMQGAETWEEWAPGERWAYFNEGYAILGLILEKLSGMSYNDYILEHILKPLGLTQTFLEPSEVEASADVAVPYTLPHDGEPEPGRYLYRTIRSEGGIISSVLELARYGSLFLGGGKGVISEASLSEMTTPRIAVPYEDVPAFGNASGAASYAYGLQTQTFYGQPLVGHGGSVLVSTAQLSFLPQRGLGVAILANGSGYPLSQIAQVALALALNEDPDALPFRQVERGLEPLCGNYESFKGTMSARVSKQGDFLKLELPDRAQPQTVILVPETLGETSQFFTLASGRRLGVTFRRTEGETSLIYDRYKFKRIGR